MSRPNVRCPQRSASGEVGVRKQMMTRSARTGSTRSMSAYAGRGDVGRAGIRGRSSVLQRARHAMTVEISWSAIGWTAHECRQGQNCRSITELQASAGCAAYHRTHDDRRDRRDLGSQHERAMYCSWTAKSASPKPTGLILRTEESDPTPGAASHCCFGDFTHNRAIKVQPAKQ